MGEKTLSRREFLKGAGIVGAGIVGAAIYEGNPQFWKLVKNSIEKGKLFQDIGEVIESRLVTNNIEKLQLGEKKDFPETWSKKCFDQASVITFKDTKGQDRPVAFLNITNTCRTIQSEVMEDAGIPLFTKTEKREEDKNKAFALLPIPQTNFSGYGMYAMFKSNGQEVTLSSSEKSSNRSALVLSQNTLIVLNPSEREAFKDRKDAEVEYAFAFDSLTLSQDLDALNDYTSPSGKKISNLSENTSAIASFYDSDGKISTYIISAYNQIDRNYNVDGEAFSFYPAQLVDIANQFMNNNTEGEKFVRFNLLLPDPGQNSATVAPERLSRKQVRDAKIDIKFHMDEVNLLNGEMAERVGEKWHRAIGRFVPFMLVSTPNIFIGSSANH